jgi:hypothetical protein
MAFKLKGQAALEFLTTYAWAFIVILTTIGALYYFGIFDIEKFVPEKCTFPPQFVCADFSMGRGRVSLLMTNTLGESINITSAEITDDFETPLSCDFFLDSDLIPANENPGYRWNSGSIAHINFTSCVGASLISGERADTRVRIVYNAISSPSKTPHTIQGRVSGSVLSS